MGEFQRKTGIIKRLIGEPIKKRNKNESEQLKRKYAEFLNKEPLEQNAVLYESYHGRGMLGNPYALFMEFVNRQDFFCYTHIWAFESLEEGKEYYQQFLEQYDNVIFVKRESEKYIKALATCKYLINNVTFPVYFVKREGQVYVNTWHGIPIKSLGYDMGDGAYENGNVIRNFLCTDYLLSPCEYMTTIYKTSYLLDGIYTNTVIEDGMPRNDFYYTTDQDSMKEYLIELGMELNKEKQMILYAPTYRGDYSNAKDRTKEFISFYKTLMENIDTDKYQVFIKPHQTEYHVLQYEEELQGKVIPVCVDTNMLLTATDILVTDYSSIVFDYLITERPILFYITDLESYKATRGLTFEIEKLPGPVTDREELVASWVNTIDEIKLQYRFAIHAMRNHYLRYDDGNVSKRILSLVLENKGIIRVLPPWDKEKRKVLFYIGALHTNGVTVSLMSLLELLDFSKYDITIYFNKNKPKKSVFDISHFREGIRFLPRVGNYLATTSEEFGHELVNQFGLTKKISAGYYPDKLYEREFRRCFGDTKFDDVIDYSGYGSFIPRVFLGAPYAKKIIWQHNNLPKDRMRMVNGVRPFETELKVVFSLYERFDKVVGCSKNVMEINRKELANKNTYEKYTYVSNSVHASRVLRGKAEAATLFAEGKTYLILEEESKAGVNQIEKMVQMPEGSFVNFCTVGRMSEEKNQKSLLEAFCMLYRIQPLCRLYMIGSGPLLEKLERYVKNHGLEEAVIFVENIENPFALMARCDCFLLPSKWEGQALVVLEARVLGLPIIVSNHPGFEAVCVENGQYVTGMDSKSIFEGMLAFIKGEVPKVSWDYEAYNRQVVREFEALLE